MTPRSTMFQILIGISIMLVFIGIYDMKTGWDITFSTCNEALKTCVLSSGGEAKANEGILVAAFGTVLLFATTNYLGKRASKTEEESDGNEGIAQI